MGYNEPRNRDPHKTTRIHWKVIKIVFIMAQFDGTFGANTLPKTNIAPENRPSQKETGIPTVHFQVLC